MYSGTPKVVFVLLTSSIASIASCLLVAILGGPPPAQMIDGVTLDQALLNEENAQFTFQRFTCDNHESVMIQLTKGMAFGMMMYDSDDDLEINSADPFHSVVAHLPINLFNVHYFSRFAGYGSLPEEWTSATLGAGSQVILEDAFNGTNLLGIVRLETGQNANDYAQVYHKKRAFSINPSEGRDRLQAWFYLKPTQGEGAVIRLHLNNDGVNYIGFSTVKEVDTWKWKLACKRIGREEKSLIGPAVNFEHRPTLHFDVQHIPGPNQYRIVGYISKAEPPHPSKEMDFTVFAADFPYSTPTDPIPLKPFVALQNAEHDNQKRMVKLNFVYIIQDRG